MTKLPKIFWISAGVLFAAASVAINYQVKYVMHHQGVGSVRVMVAQSQGVELNPAIKWAPWLMFCEQLMLGSLAMLLSLFTHPIIASVLAYFAGNGFYSLHNPLYYILPGYQDFNVFFKILESTLIHWTDILFLSLYAADFVIIMLLLALWRFRTKELV